jgi:hypothetical protein
MTREEQILNKAIDYSEIEENFLEYDDCGDVCDDKTFVEKAFIESAKWADKTMIEKVCEYLRTHLWQNVDDDNDPIVESVHNVTLDNFIKDIKRYLEE